MREAGDDVDEAGQRGPGERAEERGLDEQPVPGVEGVRQQDCAHDRAGADERQQLHDEGDDERPEHPGGAALRHHRDQQRQAGEREAGQERERPACARQGGGMAAAQHLAGQTHQRLCPGRREAGSEARDRKQQDQRHDEGARRDRLPREHGAPGGGVRQQRLPRPVPILAREHVAGHDSRDHGETPRAREAEHDERHGVPRRVHPASEERVLGNGCLDLQHHHERERGEQADGRESARRQLREQLGRLDPADCT